jgi:hypothetical protein
MTPKEKAKELVEKFSNVALLDDYESKQCALIAVDEILKVCEKEITNCSDKTFFYWQELKQEVEKL